MRSSSVETQQTGGDSIESLKYLPQMRREPPGRQQGPDLTGPATDQHTSSSPAYSQHTKILFKKTKENLQKKSETNMVLSTFLKVLFLQSQKILIIYACKNTYHFLVNFLTIRPCTVNSEVILKCKVEAPEQTLQECTSFNQFIKLSFTLNSVRKNKQVSII